MSKIQPGTSAQDLANALLKTFDTNKATKPTPDEFGAFLTKLLSGVSSASAATIATGRSGSTTSPTAVAGTGRVKFEGFDFSVPRDPRRSAKYSFANAAKTAGTMPTCKADAETWFNTNVKAKMEADGHTINWVKGDTFQFTDTSGTFVVEFVRGASSSNPALTWQPS